MLVIGLDPGGKKQFGWCVAETARKGVNVEDTGAGDNAAEVVEQITECLGHRRLSEVGAAGIDSPLFWVGNGDRRADEAVRRAMEGQHAPAVDGTVQRVNSLRGACLVQGVMAARLLRKQHPAIRLTESHPKALLWLLGIATLDKRVNDIDIDDLKPFVVCRLTRKRSHHERDAALGALAATAMLQSWPKWRDLARDDPKAFAPVSPVEYWMPIKAAKPRN
jgi:hypothetical protein